MIETAAYKGAETVRETTGHRLRQEAARASAARIVEKLAPLPTAGALGGTDQRKGGGTGHEAAGGCWRGAGRRGAGQSALATASAAAQNPPPPPPPPPNYASSPPPLPSLTLLVRHSHEGGSLRAAVVEARGGLARGGVRLAGVCRRRGACGQVRLLVSKGCPRWSTERTRWWCGERGAWRELRMDGGKQGTEEHHARPIAPLAPPGIARGSAAAASCDSSSGRSRSAWCPLPSRPPSFAFSSSMAGGGAGGAAARRRAERRAAAARAGRAAPGMTLHSSRMAQRGSREGAELSGGKRRRQRVQGAFPAAGRPERAPGCHLASSTASIQA